MIDMAFPAHWNGMFPPQTGMTLRDYFAAKAMQGLLASPLCHSAFDPKQKAASAYAVADAMLYQRKMSVEMFDAAITTTKQALGEA